MKTAARLAILATVTLLGACAGLPKTDGRPASTALKQRGGTEISRAVRSSLPRAPGVSAFHPLGKGPAALDSRLGLAAMASRSLDVQYYIWHNDPSGMRMAGGLLRAADRGVRVRVLLDDMGTSAKDVNLQALDSHPNIEVRLFNPIMTRTARMLGTVMDFGRVNRRMHNKAFIADNEIAIVGGRNIGDEYFGAAAEMNFADFDVAAIGPVVREVSVSFDQYWNSQSSIGIDALTRERASAEHVAAMRADLENQKQAPDSFTAKLRHGGVAFTPARGQVVADDPEKVVTDSHEKATDLAPRLLELVGTTRKEMLIVSPYFIPGKKGTKDLAALRARGVRVVVLTNSLAATDVAAVHAGYKRYREPLLRAGVEVYENKPSGGWGERSSGLRDAFKGGPRGSSGASLHAKTITFDRRLMFVGSMNVDPRSLQQNTEMGILVDSPELAGEFTDIILRNLTQNAYRLELAGNRVNWIATEDGKEVRFTHEPGTTAWQRFVVNVIGLLPIEHQL